jgi:hypothetical protein
MSRRANLLLFQAIRRFCDRGREVAFSCPSASKTASARELDHVSCLKRLFQSRLSGPLRLEQSHNWNSLTTGIVSQLRRSRAAYAMFVTPLARGQRCPGDASLNVGTQVPSSRDLVPISRIQHVVLFQPSQDRWGPRRRSSPRPGRGAKRDRLAESGPLPGSHRPQATRRGDWQEPRISGWKRWVSNSPENFA